MSPDARDARWPLAGVRARVRGPRRSCAPGPPGRQSPGARSGRLSLCCWRSGVAIGPTGRRDPRDHPLPIQEVPCV